jgi:hypothetical protein
MTTNTTHTVPCKDLQLELQLPKGAREIRCMASATSQTVRELVREAVTDPLEFPDLGLAILDDDHVAIAVEAGVPRAPDIVAELIAWLKERDLSPEQITVVLSAREPRALETMQQALAGVEGVRIAQHAPSNMEQLEYIAAAETADAIYIQRDLVEASVVIPIYCIRHEDALNASDLYAMSPAFADAKTQQRWHLAWLEDNQHHRQQHSKLSREAGWLMGIQFAMAIVPAADGQIARLIGGDPEKVFQAALKVLQQDPYEAESAGKHDLVIATIDGGREQQTWMNVARAVVRADALLAPAGRVVVCCDVQEITAGIAQLASDEPDEDLQRQLLDGEDEDAFAAAVLRSVQARRSVYLLAPIDASQVEGLGMAYLSGSQDIERLAASSRSVVVIHTSQY